MTTTTDPGIADPARADRLAALQAKRAGSAPARRRHPAQTSRIAAAGISVSTMFGLVAVMGLARADSGEAEAAGPPPGPSVVVVHHLPAATSATAGAAASTSSAPATVVAPPIALTAPRVAVASVAAATPTPAATHGSR